MVSARGISLLLLESRSSHTLSSSPQHSQLGTGPLRKHSGLGAPARGPHPGHFKRTQVAPEARRPSPHPSPASRGAAAPAPPAGGGVAAAFAPAASSDLGANAPAVRTRLWTVLLRFLACQCQLKSFAFAVTPARFSPGLSPWSPPLPRGRPRGCPGPRAGTPLRRSPLRAAAPRGPPLPPPLPFAPTQPPPLRLRGSKTAAPAPPAPRSATARGPRAKLGPAALRPARSCGEKPASAGRQRGGSRPHHGRPRTSPPWDSLRAPASAAPSPQTRRTGSRGADRAQAAGAGTGPGGDSEHCSGVCPGVTNGWGVSGGADARAFWRTRALPGRRTGRGPSASLSLGGVLHAKRGSPRLGPSWPGPSPAWCSAASSAAPGTYTPDPRPEHENSDPPGS
ncbi:uncharacterized protein AAES06_014507 [Glossophaga mutica]